MAKRTFFARIAARSFKPVDGGYLLVTSHPWLIGTGPSYIVTEAQKESLIAVMPPRRPWLVFIVVFGVWMAVLHLGPVALADHVPTTAFFTVGMMTLAGAAAYAFLVVMTRRKLRRMAPILANAKLASSTGEPRPEPA